MSVHLQHPTSIDSFYELSEQCATFKEILELPTIKCLTQTWWAHIVATDCAWIESSVHLLLIHLNSDILELYCQTLAGTSGSNPSSSTGIPNSDNLPSYVFTIFECASRIFFISSWMSLIASFFMFSTSSSVLLMTPTDLGSILAAANSWFSCASLVSIVSLIVSSFFSNIRFYDWIEVLPWDQSSDGSHWLLYWNVQRVRVSLAPST